MLMTTKVKVITMKTVKLMMVLTKMRQSYTRSTRFTLNIGALCKRFEIRHLSWINVLVALLCNVSKRQTSTKNLFIIFDERFCVLPSHCCFTFTWRIKVKIFIDNGRLIIPPWSVQQPKMSSLTSHHIFFVLCTSINYFGMGWVCNNFHLSSDS